MIPVQHLLFISSFLFVIGVAIVITKKHTILILMGIELIFNAANINLVAFGNMNAELNGQLFALFVIMVAACETAVALAIILNMFKHFRSVNPDTAANLKG